MIRNSRPAGDSTRRTSAAGTGRSILDALAQMCPLLARLTGRPAGCSVEAAPTRRKDTEA